AEEIFQIRLAKYPPTMKCAGSIFKNLILAELPGEVRRHIPERVVREWKAPSAYFLEQVGAKGMRSGDIHVADYHANLIYNAGQGTARELVEIISELKARVRKQFGLKLEEEVQYVGFPKNGCGC
ncbi:MAG TPA: UDP-N-acetylenolpyruvoylglucosamine reductase, partial [Bryobacteraceae bacterium]|nr:UDP-N-acetylenolpyruvoylglucosamine reductase [Bryobacteraceae bacterium]